MLGQKSYNGVAILSKFPLEDVSKEMTTLKDDAARYIEATVMSPRECACVVPPKPVGGWKRLAGPVAAKSSRRGGMRSRPTARQ